MNERSRPRVRSRLAGVAVIVGPGLVVMLSNTDAGSVITVSQSGAHWGYALLPLQFLIIPILFIAQELTVRLALFTQKGFGELVLQHFGRGPAWLAMSTLLLSCFGALLTELSGLAGVGQLFGVPDWLTVSLTAVGIFAMVLTASYPAVERVAMAIGAFLLAFLAVAWAAKPAVATVVASLWRQPWSSADFLYLVAANIGTSLMPWTLFYQQSALIDKGLGPAHLRGARMDTLAGAVICQAVTACVLIAAAAAFNGHGGSGLDSVPEIAQAFTPVLGPFVGRLIFGLALAGGALVATIVVSLSAAWALGEFRGMRHSLADDPRQAPWFYASFAVMLAAAAGVVLSGINLVRLSVATGVLNALLLPAVLGLLFRLAQRVLPPDSRLRGPYAVTVALLLGATSALSVYAGVVGTLG